MDIIQFSERIAEVTGSPLKREGRGFKVACPAHGDHTPSLSISPGRVQPIVMHCHAGCSTQDILDAVGLTESDICADDTDVSNCTTQLSKMKVERFKNYARKLPSRSHVAKHLDEVVAPAASHEDATTAHAYVMSRFGITEQHAKTLGIGYTTQVGWGARVLVPFRNPDGDLVGYQARALDTSARVRWMGPKNPEDGSAWSRIGWFPKDPAGPLANTPGTPVLVCEGPGDALTATSLGCDAIAVRGASGGVGAAAEIARWGTRRHIVVVGDCDDAGRKFNSETKTALANEGCHSSVIEVAPPSLEQANAMVADGGKVTRDLSDWAKDNREEVIARVESEIKHDEKTPNAMWWDDELYPLTEEDAARLLVDYLEDHDSGLRYCTDTDMFLMYDSGVWAPVEDTRILAKMSYLGGLAADTFLLKSQMCAMGKVDKAEVRKWERWRDKMKSSAGKKGVLSELKTMGSIQVRSDDFDRNKRKTVVRNGVMNHTTGVLEPHDKSLMATRRIEVDFDPDAQCPVFDAFLESSLPDPEVRRYLQLRLGAALVGNPGDQTFLVFKGVAASGKSTLMNVIEQIFKPFCTTVPFESLASQPSNNVNGPNENLASMENMRFIVTSEGRRDQRMSDDLIKKITGCDTIQASRKYHARREFKVEGLLVMMSNYFPKFSGDDAAIWRRVRVISWDKSFAGSKGDPDLPEKLEAEQAGILRWIMQGAYTRLNSGLVEPAAVTNATAHFQEDCDALSEFLKTQWVIDPDCNDKVLYEDLYKEYEAWHAREFGLDSHAWSRSAFEGSMKDRLRKVHADFAQRTAPSLPRAKNRTRNGKSYYLGVRKATEADLAKLTEAEATAASENAGVRVPEMLPLPGSTQPDMPVEDVSIDDIGEPDLNALPPALRRLVSAEEPVEPVELEEDLPTSRQTFQRSEELADSQASHAANAVAAIDQTSTDVTDSFMEQFEQQPMMSESDLDNLVNAHAQDDSDYNEYMVERLEAESELIEQRELERLEAEFSQHPEYDPHGL